MASLTKRFKWCSQLLEYKIKKTCPFNKWQFWIMIFCTKNLVVLTLKRAKIIYASHLKHMISVWTLMHNNVNFLRSQLEQFSSNKLCWTGIARMRAKSSSDWATYCLRKALLRFEHYHLTLNTQKGRSHGDRERKDAEYDINVVCINF